MSVEKMKLHPPSPVIPDNDPYANDLFERKELGDSLTSLFRNLEESTVVCVDAPWGDGKTTFANMWIADLLHQGKNCIYFDAYEHDHCDDPFVAFCAEIVSLFARLNASILFLPSRALFVLNASTFPFVRRSSAIRFFVSRCIPVKASCGTFLRIVKRLFFARLFTSSCSQ